jgi:hypothetical protein
MLLYVLANEEGRVVRLVHFTSNVASPLPSSITTAYTSLPCKI